MSNVKFGCSFCGKVGYKEAGAVNRANKVGMKLYCDKTCAGLARRQHKTKEQLIKEKHDYDKEYREKNRSELKKKKKEYFKKDYSKNPEKYKAIRKKKMPQHLEYCRKPEYKKKKKIYDRKYQAKKTYGEYGEAVAILLDLGDEIDNRTAKHQNGIINKSQIRKRKWQQQNSMPRI